MKDLLTTFSAADLNLLTAAGITPEVANLQLKLLREGMHRPVLLRACTREDGIITVNPEEFEALGAAFQRACAEGRWVFFIPASGAATRMAESFSDPEILRQLKAHPDYDKSVLPELLRDPSALAGMPKALMPFHRYGNTLRTPLEEHIREAAALAGNASNARVRLHFTISPEHEKLFEQEIGRVLSLLRDEGDSSVRAEITHSFQDPATQTIALDPEGNPFRDAAGNLLLRPGGHGALLRNLQSSGGEFVWIRNIDNIPVERIRVQGRPLRRALGGMLMRAAASPSAASPLASGEHPVRPLRICGMVANTGEPGGGPFWIAHADANRPPETRIVEAAEADMSNPDQAAVFRAATHFNPVDLACALRDASGKPFSLEDFSDPSSSFIAEKSHEGRTLRALEWPGLWNGAMAGWNTQCVEIPLSQFAPVKTVADLLRPEHLS